MDGHFKNCIHGVARRWKQRGEKRPNQQGVNREEVASYFATSRWYLFGQMGKFVECNPWMLIWRTEAIEIPTNGP